MEDKLLYLDSSALVKLVVPEKESGVLQKSLSVWPVRVTSELARVEVMRAARRATEQPGIEKRVEEVMAGLYLLKMDGDILSEAARLEPRIVRSLDAIHLASALSLGTDLGAIVTYVGNMAAAAAGCGLQVLAPGSVGKDGTAPAT